MFVVGNKENLVPTINDQFAKPLAFSTVMCDATEQSTGDDCATNTAVAKPVVDGQLFNFGNAAPGGLFSNSTGTPSTATPPAQRRCIAPVLPSAGLFGGNPVAPAAGGLFASATAAAADGMFTSGPGPAKAGSKRPCGECKEMFAKKQYSTNQWSKGSGVSRCKSCVKSNATPSFGIEREVEDSAMIDVMAEALRNMSCGEEDEDEDEDEESSDDDSSVQQAGCAAESSAPPIDQQDMDEVLRTFRMLSEAGVPVLEPTQLSFDHESMLGEGGNGTVCEGTALMDSSEDSRRDVAIKTIFAGGSLQKLQGTLSEFESEVTLGYKAGLPVEGTNVSRICTTLAAAFEVNTDSRKKSKRFKLYLLMEQIEASGDLHDAVIHDSSNWQCVRSGSKDTGARCGAYFSVDDDNDVFNYVMPFQRKLKLAEEVAQSLLQLQKHGVVHLDIKPSNLLFTDDGHLKLIDFGEAVTHSADGQLEFTAGTPGYMAPEVVYGEGHYSADMFSAGVTLLELWVGSLWGESKDSTGEDEMMQIEINKALSKVSINEPKIAQLLRACMAEEPTRRCTPKKLLKSLKELRGNQNTPSNNTKQQQGNSKKHNRNKKRK